MGAPFKTPIKRQTIRARMERAVEKLLAALDAMDAEVDDLEDEHEDGDESDYEPSLAAPEASYSVYPLDPGGPLVCGRMTVSQVVWCGGGGEDCEEGDDNGIADEGGLQEAWHAAI